MSEKNLTVLKKISLYVISLFYVLAGFNHFKNPEIYLKMMPSYLPWPEALNSVSGAAEMALGMMLLRPETRSIAAWSLILLLIAVFPANISMYMQGGAAYGLPEWALALRLPMQVVLIAWAYWHTRNKDIDTEIIETEILIGASSEKVWRELTTFAKYSEWNPFIVQAQGEGRTGERMEMVLRPPDVAEFKFRNTILESVEPQRLSWRGSFIFRGLFDGTHYFRIEPQDQGVRLIHGEKFEGILVRALAGILVVTKRGFVMMNEALKVRCES